MFLVGILSWWYKDGWVGCASLIKERLASSADFFSVGLLASTLFAPFRQISAGRVDGPIDKQMRALVDRSISRFIGAFVRLVMIIVGFIVMLFQFVFGALVLLFWPVIPIVPVIGMIMTAIGWVPKWM